MRMRRATTDKKIIVKASDGQVIGINLGWDFIAEHEWGINTINRAFGIPGKPERRLLSGDLVGADVRTVTNVPAEFALFEAGYAYSYLLFDVSIGCMKDGELTVERLNKMLEAYKGDEELTTAWCRDSFGIRMKNNGLGFINSGTSVLAQIYDAFANCDSMIFLGGDDRNNVFARRGLTLAIRSRVTEEDLLQMREADKDYLDLVEAVEKTGIENKLAAAGKRYHRLLPSWTSDTSIKPNGKLLKTTHPIFFWLNPVGQDRNSFGWYTVEQLLEWIDGKGPIPNKNV